MKVPLCKPDIGEEEIQAVREVLESGWLVHGPKTKEFEKQFAEFIGVKYATSVNSCASALHASILAHKVHGEILVPSFTFPASANAIINANCTPVFVDIEDQGYMMDLDTIEDKITEKTVAIMPVHYAGQSIDMHRLGKIAQDHNLIIIEDSAEAIGSVFDGKKTGSFGTGCFSFFPVKNMTTGEGGMVTTNDEQVAQFVKTLSGHGIQKSTHDRVQQEKPWVRTAILPGYNYRMNDIQSALGLVQLKKLDRMNAQRQENADYLTKQLRDIEGITPPVVLPNRNHTYQMYIARLDKTVDRTKFIAELRKNEVEVSVNFEPPVHLQEYCAQYGSNKGDLPVTEAVSESVVTLPMYPRLSKEQIDHVVSTITSILKK
jgi:perosamine synthetase